MVGAARAGSVDAMTTDEVWSVPSAAGVKESGKPSQACSERGSSVRIKRGPGGSARGAWSGGSVEEGR